MLFNLLTAATLATFSAAAPLTGDKEASTLSKRTEDPTPSNVPFPPAGQCALVVLSDTILPFGDEPTTEGGEGLGSPSSQGGRIAGVINTNGDTVGDYVDLNTDSPGFDATITLSDMITDPEDVTMTAEMVTGSEKGHWGVIYHYKGVEYDCKDCEWTDTGGDLSASYAMTGNFPC